MLVLLPLFSLSAQTPVVYETEVSFRNFTWGTSEEDVIKKMGQPISREAHNEMVSLVWENVPFGEYITYTIAYFSKSGLQAGIYYFVTNNLDHLGRCFTALRQELKNRYGPTLYMYEGVVRELRLYECSWNLPGGYIYLKTNTRQGEPVSLWYSSPEFTKQLFGDKPVTAHR